MAYGTTKVDVIQSSTANVPVQFNDGNGAQVGTLCRAWVNFNGTGTVAIRASFNVSSITDNGTGTYTVNFTTAMPDANYAIAGVGSYANVMLAYADSTYTPTTTSVKVSVFTSAGTAYDGNAVSLAVFR